MQERGEKKEKEYMEKRCGIQWHEVLTRCIKAFLNLTET